MDCNKLRIATNYWPLQVPRSGHYRKGLALVGKRRPQCQAPDQWRRQDRKRSFAPDGSSFFNLCSIAAAKPEPVCYL
jgi:hypothetical protein